MNYVYVNGFIFVNHSSLRSQLFTLQHGPHRWMTFSYTISLTPMNDIQLYNLAYTDEWHSVIQSRSHRWMPFSYTISLTPMHDIQLCNLALQLFIHHQSFATHCPFGVPARRIFVDRQFVVLCQKNIAVTRTAWISIVWFPCLLIFQSSNTVESGRNSRLEVWMYQCIKPVVSCAKRAFGDLFLSV